MTTTTITTTTTTMTTTLPSPRNNLITKRKTNDVVEKQIKKSSKEASSKPLKKSEPSKTSIVTPHLRGLVSSHQSTVVTSLSPPSSSPPRSLSLGRVPQLVVNVERSNFNRAANIPEIANVVVSPVVVTTTPAAVVTTPPPPPTVPRRRHAAIPRRITYQIGLDVTEEVLERQAASPFFAGPMIEYCRHCGAKFFKSEPKNRAGDRLICCKNGQVKVEGVRTPIELKRLFINKSHQTVEFLENIRRVNNLFAMASFKTSAPDRQTEGQGRWSFSICGQIYHFMVGVPTSQDLRRPQLSHYYFLDVEEVIDKRNDCLENAVSPDTIALIERCLRKCNKYIKAFKTMGEMLEEETARRGERPVNDVVIAFSSDMNARRRAYDLPESRSEIAAVFYGMDPPFPVDLKLYPRSNVSVSDDSPVRERHHELKNLNPMCDPMVYPILFPYAEDGYSVNLRQGNHKITMREFYRYRIQCRDLFSSIHNGGKLFQQYIVDAWVKVEANMLWYIRQHQDKFRFAANQAIRRAIAQNPENARRVGRAVILPSAYTGGPRYMQRLYYDAMSVVARHGKPDLFITFTCDPTWREIAENLEYNQKPENRPDLVCRVFHVKFLEFVDDVVNKQIYGIVQNYHYVIEFQKRGLPHAHMVVTFIPDDRLHTAEQVDEIVSVVIPDVETQPLLYGLVAKHQVHRPCGRLDPNAVCMKDGKCKKFFPKSYTERTILGGGTDSRPLYKRPRDNRFIQLSNCIITNTRIVPFNPYALSKFQSHINFEVVGSVLSLKYLYKYVTKGPDCVTIYEHDRSFVIDEVQNYLDLRYVSSMEAAWRLHEFKIHDRSHAVIVLPVHLPGEHFVTFEEEDDIEHLEHRLGKRSKLEAWFQLNVENAAQARTYKYVEIPEHFVWNNKDAKWSVRRQVSKVIGCIAEVSPRHGDLELFYLRLLLRHVRGATSFESLRTVDGVVKDTFLDACHALHLLEHTDEYDLCLREAALTRHPRQMRRLFGLILGILNDETIAQAPLLWRTHRDSLTEDFRGRGGMSRGEAYSLCVERIETILRRTRPDLNCAALGIVADDIIDSSIDSENNDGGNAELRFNEEEEEEEEGENRLGDWERRRLRYAPNLLNKDQKKIFLRIVQSVTRTRGRLLPVDLYDALGDDVSIDDIATSRPRETLFFVDGPGGTGKTFLYNALIAYVTGELGLSVVSVAWTGIAANLLIGGKTVHRTFRLPINLTATSTVGWHVETAESETFGDVALILWDEAPMTHRYAVEAVDRYMREVSDATNIPMGGKCCVFGGDFRQVLPVVFKAHKASVVDASLKRLSFWNDVTELKLTINLRTAIRTAENKENFQERSLKELGNRTFEGWLLALGEGRLPYVNFESLKSVPADLVEIPSLFHSPNLQELIRFVYADGITAENVGDSAILCPTNATVDEVNAEILAMLEGEIKTYISVDECKTQEEDELEIPVDLLNAVNVPMLPPHELMLKVGAIVMLIRNLDVENGECNGTRMRVIRLGEHLIECQSLCGENKGRKILLPRIRMIARDTMIPQEVMRTQFPVRLAYAMTINKSQGQTMRKVGIYLKRPCFSHGQLYVAFSRVGNPQNVRVCVEDGLKQGSFRHKGGKKFTRNVVYHALLKSGAIPTTEDVVQRQIIPRMDVCDEADLQELFGIGDEDRILEEIDISQIIRNAEKGKRILAPHERNGSEKIPLRGKDDDNNEIGLGQREERNTTNRQSRFDLYVDEAGADIRGTYVPYRNSGELTARVSVRDRPGTSGVGLRRLPIPRRRTSSSSESD